MKHFYPIEIWDVCGCLQLASGMLEIVKMCIYDHNVSKKRGNGICSNYRYNVDILHIEHHKID